MVFVSGGTVGAVVFVSGVAVDVVVSVVVFVSGVADTWIWGPAGRGSIHHR